MMRKKLEKYASRSVATLCLGLTIGLFTGIIFAWTNFATPIAEEFDWTSTQMTFNFTLVQLFMGIGAIAGGLLSKKHPPAFVLRVTAIVFAVGFFLASTITKDTLFLLYLGYGIIAASAAGMCSNAISNAVVNWFPGNVGTVAGIMALGSGLSTILLGTLSSYMATWFGWRQVFVGTGLVSALVIAAGSMFFRLPREGELPAVSDGRISRYKSGGIEFSVGQMLKTSGFWVFFVWTGLMFGITSAESATAKQVADSIGTPELMATLAIGFIQLSNGIGAIIGGVIYDKVGRTVTMRLQNIFYAIGIAMALISTVYSIPILFVSGIWLMGLSGGGLASTNSSFVAEFYGLKNFALNMSIMNLRSIPASFISTLGGYVQTETNSYTAVYVLLLALALAGFGLQFFVRRPKTGMVSTEQRH